MKKYKQLDLEQRYIIQNMLSAGYTKESIAQKIGVHRSTVYRELSRNTSKLGCKANRYDADLAERKSKNREQEKEKSFRFSYEMLKYIREKLREDRWSPELISHRGKMEFGDFVSTETIYQYIWMAKHSKQKSLTKDRDLHTYLKHNRRRQKRKNSKGNRGRIPNRTPISERPQEANQRTRYGDLEVDLMMGSNHKPSLIAITDRSTIHTRLIKVDTKDSKVVANKIIERLKGVKDKIHTLTFDNDLAFAAHEKIAKALNLKTYFTRPYTSQDKGTVENRIGQIRRFIPKGTCTLNMHSNNLKSIERKLNNRPVRKFDYLTPIEKMKLLTTVALVS